MADIIFETVHKPIGSFPYIEFINKDLNYVSHYHEEIEIAYIESGSITAYSGSTEIILNPGDICIFMPGEIHSFMTTSQNNVYIIKIAPSSYVENINFDRIRLTDNKISPSDMCYIHFQKTIGAIYKEYTAKNIGYEFIIRSLKNIFIADILRFLEYTYTDSQRNIHLLNKVNSYLEQNYHNKITLEELAGVCHLSKYYFSHSFKEITGMSAITYVSLFRIRKSTIILKYTDKSMTDIALECGFGNVRSFNRIFKQQFNITPLKYRQINRENKKA